ncbi:hypothetical protein THAR02_01742 [Trichoderma harzianum]|uniref:Uncharacterized protein n=1 Tax=Trichoderma harzianum TaxID=5544 RepID=A0A0G0ANR3_TRIHA|nr:hypothetical protein THAR02_01742 [Trichoderma harzianum]
MSTASDRVELAEPERVYDAQPKSHQAMGKSLQFPMIMMRNSREDKDIVNLAQTDAQQPHPETTDDVNMRGGDDGDCSLLGRLHYLDSRPITALVFLKLVFYLPHTRLLSARLKMCRHKRVDTQSRLHIPHFIRLGHLRQGTHRESNRQQNDQHVGNE